MILLFFFVINAPIVPAANHMPFPRARLATGIYSLSVQRLRSSLPTVVPLPPVLPFLRLLPAPGPDIAHSPAAVSRSPCRPFHPDHTSSRYCFGGGEEWRSSERSIRSMCCTIGRYHAPFPLLYSPLFVCLLVYFHTLPLYERFAPLIDANPTTVRSNV